MDRTETGADCVIQDLDAPVAPTVVSVLVLSARKRVLDFHALDVHGVGLRWRNGRCTTSPALGIYGSTWVSSIPKTETDFHGCLGEMIACFSCSERADGDAVNRPNQSGWRPVKPVCVELHCRAGHLYILGNIIVWVAFPIVVGFDLAVVRHGSRTFPINFVKVIRKKDHTADYTFTERCFHHVFDTPEEEFPIRMHGGSIISLRKCEFGPIGTVADILIICECPITRLGFDGSEVNEVGAGCKTLVIRASF